MKIAFHTLGCKNNQLETSTISDEFAMSDWEIVDFDSVADFYVINTCSVTAKSDSHSKAAIRRAHKLNPAAKIIVTGCFAQMESEEISHIDGVWMVTGNKEKVHLFNLVQTSLERNEKQINVANIMENFEFEDKKVYSASGRTRINVKIQDGCNYRCSYCIVPFARGKSRSNKLENVITQISEVAHNYPEVVLTAIHLGQYGKDLNPPLTLTQLLKELEQIDHLQRLRLSSIDPHEINDELIEVLANSKKICRHLHISLQSANNDILKAMNRRYTVDEYTILLYKLVSAIPGLAIGSDIIVGFPGETNKQFDITYHNLEKLPLSYFHVFSYSKRKGTVAAKMVNQVDQTIKKERNHILKELSKNKNLHFRRLFENKILHIIPELSRDKATNMLKGLSDNYISVLVEGEDSLKSTIVPVKIRSVTPTKTVGELVYE